MTNTLKLDLHPPAPPARFLQEQQEQQQQEQHASLESFKVGG